MLILRRLLQYEALIEQFKGIHRESEAVKNSGYGTAELRKDIEEMEKEKEIVAKRIERMQRKVDGTPNSEKMLDVAKKLRTEREREKELQTQKQEQRNAIQVCAFLLLHGYHSIISTPFFTAR